MTAYVRTLEEYLQKIQPEWDDLFKRHRLTFVTHGNEKLLTFFSELQIIGGTYEKDEAVLLLKNQQHTCRINVSSLKNTFISLTVKNPNKTIFKYTAFGFRDVYPDWDLTPEIMENFIPFVNEIKTFTENVAESIQFYTNLEKALRQRLRG